MNGRVLRSAVALAGAGLIVAPLLAVGLLGQLAAQGCGSGEADIENLCGWLGNPDNCYRKFFEDVGDQCGRADLGSAPQGGFLARDKLDICILNEGGQVLFDPPLDLAAFPLTTTSFKLIGADGTACGSASFGGTHSFSVSIDPYPPDGGSTSGAGGGGGSASGGETIVGGTFSSTNPAGRQVFDTACPSGDAHHFDLLQTSECPEYAAIVPRAELESNAGGIDLPGYVIFRVFHPPAAGALEDAQPQVVEYFDCRFPGAPKPCEDQARNGSETDIDCGGALCGPCQEGQGCIQDSDCATGTCGLEMGLKKCLPGGGVGGAGGTGGSSVGAGGAGGVGGG
jgi:hypothetical protein